MPRKYTRKAKAAHEMRDAAAVRETNQQALAEAAVLLTDSDNTILAVARAVGIPAADLRRALATGEIARFMAVTRVAHMDLTSALYQTVVVELNVRLKQAKSNKEFLEMLPWAMRVLQSGDPPDPVASPTVNNTTTNAIFAPGALDHIKARIKTIDAEAQ